MVSLRPAWATGILSQKGEVRRRRKEGKRKGKKRDERREEERGGRKRREKC